MVSYPWRVQNKFEVIFYFFVTTVYGTKKSVIDKYFLSECGNTDSYKGKQGVQLLQKNFAKKILTQHQSNKFNELVKVEKKNMK